MSKYFEPAYLVILASSMINWIIEADKILSSLTAIALGIMTIFYMWFKIKDMILSVKLKKKQLKEDGKV